MRRLFAALLVSGLLTVAAPAQACACGGVVDQPGRDTSVTSETALLVWDGTDETILLQLGTRTDAVSAGLIVPTPSPATVELGDDLVFGDLAQVTQPREESRWHLFGPALLGGGGDADSAGGPGGPGGVQVLSTVDLGPLQATTIAAANTPALQQWLTSNDFDASPELLASLAPYVQETWTFVALKLHTSDESLQGDLPPIAMHFASKEAVYPMRMSSAATESQLPLVYVLSQHRMLRTDPLASGVTRPETWFADQVSPTDVRSGDLKDWLATTPYLTKTSQWFPDPAAIVSDLTFEPAAEDTPFHQVTYDEHYLLPGDLGALLVLVLLVGAVWLVIRLWRRPAPPSGTVSRVSRQR
ncbi:MAG: DUF2330 domain-containing protein [Nocardioides sp.]